MMKLKSSPTDSTDHMTSSVGIEHVRIQVNLTFDLPFTCLFSTRAAEICTRTSGLLACVRLTLRAGQGGLALARHTHVTRNM